MSEPKFIAVQECSAGNASVGTEWLETRIFSKFATLDNIWAWRETLPRGCSGRLIITQENEPIDEETNF